MYINVILVLVALYILLGGEQDYDERQTVVQGKAAKYSLGTVLIYSLLWMCYSFSGYEMPFSTGMVLLIGCSLTLMVYLTVIIWMDAYIPRNFPGFHWFLLVLGLACMMISAVYFFRVDAAAYYGEAYINAASGIVFSWAGILLLGRQFLHKRKAED